MISGALFFTLIVNTIASLQLFAEVYTMYFGNKITQESTSDAALFYVVYLFQQAFQFLHMGFASAMAWLLFVIILTITVIQVRVGTASSTTRGTDMATVQDRTGRTLGQPVRPGPPRSPSGSRPASPGAGGPCCSSCSPAARSCSWSRSSG
jgi:hypothetical protein